MTKQKVLIVGGGFGGVKAALDLAEDDRLDITILSDNDFFQYYPRLYHVATGGTRENASIPLRSIFEGKNVTIKQGRAATIDRKQKLILTDQQESYPYDTLILSLGVINNYFHIPGLEELSYGIKSIRDIEILKNHLHQQLVSEHKPDLNYIVVGGGPTGIELAGSLPDYLKKLMDLHGIERRSVHVDLVEAAPRLLPKMPKDVARTIKKRLEKHGVKVYVGQAVQGETANELMVNGKPIQSHTVIWTAGMANHPFFSANNFTLTPNHKVATDIFLQAEENIFVLGDNANTPYSGMAQTALHDGKFVAENLKRKLDGKAMKSYRAHMPTTIIPVGEDWAAVIRGNLKIYGWLGYALRQSADAIAFHDYEPWVQAGHQWLTYYGSEETCQVCLESIGPNRNRQLQTEQQ